LALLDVDDLVVADRAIEGLLGALEVVRAQERPDAVAYEALNCSCAVTQCLLVRRPFSS
jgi:hypothetical protein